MIFDALAQPYPSSYEELLKEYPDESIVQLLKKVKYTIGIDKDGLDINVVTKENFIFLKNSAAHGSKRSIYSSKFREVVKYEANSYYLQDGKYKKIAVKEYDEVNDLYDDIFFDDYKRWSFTFPRIAAGTIIELNATQKLLEPRFMSPIYLSGSVPIDEFELIVEVDENIDISFFNKNIDLKRVNYSERKVKKKIIYKWSDKNVERMEDEDYSPGIRYYVPHIVPIIRGYKNKGDNVTILGGSSDLNSWYFSFIQDLDNDIDEEALSKIVLDIIKDCKTEKEKAEKLYYWVQNNIKYIAFEYGMGGFVPRKPDEVCSKRYGDCKDKSSLLRAFMSLAGIKSYMTWVGTREIPYTYSEIPSPISDNHMILTYIDQGNNYHFLDGTAKYHTLGLTSSFIQGKEALICKGSDDFEIREIPVTPYDKNYAIDSVNLTLDGTQLIGSASLTLAGYPKISFQYAINGAKKEDEKEMLEEILQKGSNKFLLKDYNISQAETYAHEMRIPYTFMLDNYAKSVEDKLFINLNLFQEWLTYKIEKDRKTPFQLRFASGSFHEYSLIIPEGYHIDYLPADKSEKNELYRFEIDYEIDGNRITYSHKIVVDFLMMEIEKLADWNKFLRQLEKAYKETIVLKKDD